MTTSATLATVTRSELEELESRIRASASKANSLDVAAQAFTREMFDSFPGSTALARVYATVPYGVLPTESRAFVEKLVAAKGDQGRLQAETPVLSLLGSYGLLPEWRDRKLSQGHVGIPLIDSRFVASIPMVARLLQELGSPLDWLDDTPAAYVRRLVGGFNGVFYVPEAATAKDAHGRLIVPAQDFVAEHNVKTVFGMGGHYLDGTLVLAIVFARESLPRSQAETFASLISNFKTATSAIVRRRAIFTG
jgi:hypothetical protein